MIVAGFMGGLVSIYDIPQTGIITKANITFFNGASGGALGTAETSTVSIRKNNTTDVTISSVVTNDASITTFSNTALNISVTGDYTDWIEIKWVTPTWVTNPTNIRIAIQLFIRTN